MFTPKAISGSDPQKGLKAAEQADKAMEVQRKAAEVAALNKQAEEAKKAEAAAKPGTPAVIGLLGQNLTRGAAYATARQQPGQAVDERAAPKGKAGFHAQTHKAQKARQESSGLPLDALARQLEAFKVGKTEQISTSEQLEGAFRQQVQALARKDPNAFLGILEQAYGLQLESKAARAMLQQAQDGTLPVPKNVVIVDSEALHGNRAAFSPSDGGTIFLSKELLGDSKALLRAYTEEMGHLLDPARVRGSDGKTGDSGGDEGEIFGKGITNGGKISDTEAQALKRDRDTGEVIVRGQKHQVEFQAGGSPFPQGLQLPSLPAEVRRAVNQGRPLPDADLKGLSAPQESFARLGAKLNKQEGIQADDLRGADTEVQAYAHEMRNENPCARPTQPILRQTGGSGRTQRPRSTAPP